MNDNLEDKLISLNDASKACSYSADYLNLRIRQGKLKGVKVGRNWLTTKTWIDEYIQKAEKYKNQLAGQKTLEKPANIKSANLLGQLFQQAGFGFLKGAIVLFVLTVYAFNAYLVAEKIPLSEVLKDFSNWPNNLLKAEVSLSNSISDSIAYTILNSVKNGPNGLYFQLIDGANELKNITQNRFHDFSNFSNEFSRNFKENSVDFFNNAKLGKYSLTNYLANISDFIGSLEDLSRRIALFIFKPWLEEIAKNQTQQAVLEPSPTPFIASDRTKEIIKETVKVVQIQGTQSQVSDLAYFQLYSQLLSRVAALEARPVAGPNSSASGAALSSSVYADGWGMQVRGSGTFDSVSATNGNISNVFTVGQLALDSAATLLDSNAGGNLTFTDAVSGTWTLAQLAGGGGGGIGANLSSTTNDFLSNNGSIVLGGRLLVNNETLTFDFETVPNTIGISSSGTALNFNALNMLTTGTLGAGAITGTSFIIGANTLTTAEWANLDGVNQTLATTSSPSFVTVTGSTSVVANTMTLATGSITDSSGAISFGNENISTTGTVGIGTVANATRSLYISDTLRSGIWLSKIYPTYVETLEPFLLSTEFNWATGERNRSYRLFEESFQDTRSFTTTGVGAFSDSVKGYALSTDNRFQDVGDATGALIYNYIGSDFSISDSESFFNIDSNDQTLNTTGSNINIDAQPQIFNDANFKYNVVGNNVSISESTWYFGAGTPAVNVYGSKVNLSITTGTGYGYYLTGSPTWGFYNDSTGDNWLGKDDSDSFFGTAKDAKIVFNGSGLLIQSDLVTASDYFQLRGGTNGIDFNIGNTEQITLTDGKLTPTTNNDIDLGDSTHLWKDIWTIGKAYFRDSGLFITSNDDGVLDIDADTRQDFNIGTTAQINLTDGKIAPTTNNDIDLGDDTHRFKDLYLVGATIHMGSSGDEGTLGYLTGTDMWSFTNNISAVTITGTTSVIANTLTLATGSITDSTGNISFSNENLSTTGTIQGAALKLTNTGIYDAANFNGSTNIDASDASIPTGNNNFSVSMWINTTDTGFKVLLAAGTHNDDHGWLCDISAGYPEITKTYVGDYRSNVYIADGNWHHIVWVWNGSDKKIYVDNVDTTVSFAVGSTWTALDVVLNRLEIACYYDSGYQGRYIGYMEEIQIYNIALDSSDVADLWNSGDGKYGAATGKSGNLVGGYHLNDDATDFSGNGHDGTWVGTPAYVTGVIPSSGVKNIAFTGGSFTFDGPINLASFNLTTTGTGTFNRVGLSTWTADGDVAVYKNNGTGLMGVQSSDIRLKKNITPINNALDIVNNISGVTFNWIGDSDGSEKVAGVIAQDVLKVMPELTFTISSSDGQTYYGVHYEKLSVILIEAIKEQQKILSQVKDLMEPVDATNSGVSSEGITNVLTLKESIVKLIKDTLASLGFAIENGIGQIKEIVAEKITAKTIVIDNLEADKARLKKLEMVDSTTGEIYCTWIENGEWKKTKGECNNLTISEPVITPNPTPTPDPDNSNPTDQQSDEQSSGDSANNPSDTGQDTTENQGSAGDSSDSSASDSGSSTSDSSAATPSSGESGSSDSGSAPVSGGDGGASAPSGASE